MEMYNGSGRCATSPDDSHLTNTNDDRDGGGGAQALETSGDHQYVYSCRMCRHVLFTQGEIVPHGADFGSENPKAFGRRGRKNQTHDSSANTCTSYFLNPDVSTWVAAESREVHLESSGTEVLPDTIYCPNSSCSAKIGAQSWVGSQCSCGIWVTPAFRIHSRAVDKLLVRSL
uniref:Uncharacterized protein TCIL3000_11_13760 n=1 Tax=Trypanosoma congolense (strain IL3000) TaxID=1068625 RepID=G0V2J8_TRYCI|nr:unnamed protein product [Trypanosoma congolense IL3000]